MTGNLRGTNYWFRPRRYGYGAAPATWQGWVAIAAFPIVMALAAFVVFVFVTPPMSIILFMIFVPVALIAFIAFVRQQTDGEWRWRWNEKN